ncbi:MAG: hypothetical protein KA314_04480 [Chloroflexi bacterium]|nr:hypothetical protein [Chloroflexota bacterium]
MGRHRRTPIDLMENPGNPLELIRELQSRIESLERIVISPEAADERYAQINLTGFHVHKNGSDQGSVAPSTWTKVTWSTEVFDRAEDFDLTNSKFIAAAAGEYLFGSTIKWTTFASGATSQLCLYLNGAPTWYGPTFHSGSTSSIGATVQVIVQLSVDDEVELYARHTTPIANRTIEGDAMDTYWWGMRMQ